MVRLYFKRALFNCKDWTEDHEYIFSEAIEALKHEYKEPNMDYFVKSFRYVPETIS